MDANPGVTIEIMDVNEEVGFDILFQQLQEELTVQLMAGAAPVLMDGALVDYLDPHSAYFLADWLPIMGDDPNFNEEDWFMNFIDAVTVDDRLLSFPISMSYLLVVANNTVTGPLEALSVRNTVTFSELMELHRELSADNSLYFLPYFSAVNFIYAYIYHFVCFEEGRVDLDSEEFINFINYAKEITNPDGESFGMIPWHPTEEIAWSETYLFNITSSLWYHYFLDFEGSLFTEMTPITNEEGELLVYPTNSYVLNANATPVEQALAWDFIQFITRPENQPSGVHIASPTNRNLLRFAVERDLPSDRFGSIRYSASQGWRLTDTEDEAIERTIVLLTAFGEMSMVSQQVLPNQVIGENGVIAEALTLFQDGLVSAEQTAANLQTKIELILMEMGRL